MFLKRFMDSHPARTSCTKHCKSHKKGKLSPNSILCLMLSLSSFSSSDNMLCIYPLLLTSLPSPLFGCVFICFCLTLLLFGTKKNFFEFCLCVYALFFAFCFVCAGREETHTHLTASATPAECVARTCPPTGALALRAPSEILHWKS